MEKRQWLADIRVQLGFATHEAAAEDLHIERSTYTKAELGYPIGIKTAKKVARQWNFDWTLFFDQDCDVTGQSQNHTA